MKKTFILIIFLLTAALLFSCRSGTSKSSAADKIPESDTSSYNTKQSQPETDAVTEKTTEIATEAPVTQAQAADTVFIIETTDKSKNTSGKKTEEGYDDEDYEGYDDWSDDYDDYYDYDEWDEFSDEDWGEDW